MNKVAPALLLKAANSQNNLGNTRSLDVALSVECVAAQLLAKAPSGFHVVNQYFS
jgi:hypothetical protein